ncbi:MAG: hypothetical protein JXA67_22760, partial [Micromonosporaceae bacterium]|nr:hypothetical protein [Micromonosporaceae bacterium]
RIAELQRRTQAAKAVFDDLIKEPTNLPKRMTSLQQEIATIETDKAGDPQKTDFKRLYAAALVAGWHLDQIWRGFGNTNDYVSCLCRALKRQLRGHATIAVLLGRQAEHQCHRDAAAAHCVHLREQTVDEVMAQYVRLLAETAGGQAHGLAGGGEADPGAGAEGDRSLRRRRNRDRDRYGY